MLSYMFVSTSIQASNELPQAGAQLPTSNSLQWMDKYPNDSNTGCTSVSPTWLSVADVKWIDIQANSNNNWIDSGIMTKAGKSISVEIPKMSQNFRKLQKRYLVLHRVDPRFPVIGQTFIIELGTNNKPISRLHNFENGKLLNYQNENSSNFQNGSTNFTNAINLQKNFFNGADTKISVKAGDVIDIALISSVDFFNKLQLKGGTEKSGFTGELYPRWDGYKYYKPYGIYTVSLKSNVGVVDNALLVTGQTSDKKALSKLLVGVKSIDSISSFEKCNLNNLSKSKSCIMQSGTGMEIKLDQEVLKSKFDKFLVGYNVGNAHSSAFLDKPIEGMYHIVAKSDGDLSFSTPLFNNNVKYRTNGLQDVEYSSILSSCSTLNEFEQKFLNSILSSKQEIIQGIVVDKTLVGRYLMYITIDRHNIVSDEYDGDIEYIISNTTPTLSTKGTTLPRNGINIVTSESAKLWFRFVKTNNEQFNLKVTVPPDSEGKIKVAGFFYDNIYIPIKQKVEKFSKLFYFGLAKNAALKKVFSILAILYITLYGIYFLLGVVKVTAYDLLIRCSKIIVIAALFNENSQYIFYDTLFPMFDGGINSLISYAVKTTASDVNNPFKFLDLVVSRYIDVNFLKIILIEIVNIHNGLTILGILTLWSIMRFIIIMVKVCMELLMSMIAIAILVGLAPMFIVFILFDRIAEIFKRWLSALLLNTLMPVIMIIFILIINELMLVAVEAAFPEIRICWGTLFDIELNLDLSAIGLPTAFSIPLMAVPFYKVVFMGGNLFNAMDLGNSFAGSLAGVFLLYNLVLLAGTLVGSQVFTKGINRKGMSYVKSIMMQLLS
ncbi:TrbL/VirB6 family protein [Orientia tsutsugamushi]|uniref:type IV secretion system protein n=1 Tax=Orientia tsutsugamushi TaxID=784 RepID=UPI001EED8FFC|nr:type IV secretion system protein [Orientia tsutsugamushi]